MRCIPTELTNKNGWELYLSEYKLEDEKRREVIFALGNGVIMSRAATLESVISDYHYPGTYRAVCYEQLESIIEGECDQTESLANLPNWLSLQFRIGSGDWFRFDDADLLSYRHGLDLQNGIACREWTFRDVENRRTCVRENRLMSMTDPELGVIEMHITPLNWSAEMEVRSAIDGAVVNANVQRYLDYEQRHVAPVSTEVLNETDILLRSRTRNASIEIAMAARTLIHGVTVDRQKASQSRSSVAQVFNFKATQGKTLTIEKFAVIEISSSEEVPSKRRSGTQFFENVASFAQHRVGHEVAWKDLWEQVDFSAEQPDVALALRFQAFHLLQTISHHSATIDTGIPARGWHGEVYRGQIFWDELFVLPFFISRFPNIARAALLYRHRRLDAAKDAARQAGFGGAMFPWRSASSGKEVTPKHQKNLITGQWTRDPTHLQHHVGSAIAFNVWRYYISTGDYKFLVDYGAEMIFEIARFWASIAQLDKQSSRFDICGVIGPDEYHNRYPGAGEAGLNNNAYTNLMAAWVLCRAMELQKVLGKIDFQQLKRRLNISDKELKRWDDVSRNLRLFFHDDEVISQFDGFHQLRPFDRDFLPAAHRHARIDWALQAEGKTADEYQVTKQADTLTVFYLLAEEEIRELFHRLGYTYKREMLHRSAEYYLQRSSHRSSLSQVVYAGALAYAQPALSWSLFRKALATDLKGLDGQSTAEGIHLGAMGGCWDILQRCYAGLSPSVDGLRVSPAVPRDLGVVQFGFIYRDQSLSAATSACGVTISSANENTRRIKLLTAQGESEVEPGKSLFVANTVATEDAMN